MPKITYIASDGRETVVDAPCGTNAMEAAVQNLVPGIDGDCGGVAACGTCHVFVDARWVALAGKPEPGIETEMLALTADSQGNNSRLACQIKIRDELDGLILRMPESQH